MPIYTIRDLETNRTVKIKGDNPPTDNELAEIFSSLPAPRSPEPKHDVSYAEGLGHNLAKGATFGFADEIQALGGSAVAHILGDEAPGDDFGDTYLALREGLNSRKEVFDKENPNTALAAEVAGGLTTGGLGFTKVLGTQAVKNAGKVGKGLATVGVGATEGGLYGAGSAKVGQRVEGAAKGAALGGVVSGAGGVVVNGVSKVIKNKQTEKLLGHASPTVDVLKNNARAIYNKIEESGATIKPSVFSNLAYNVSSRLKKEGYMPEIHTNLNSVLKAMQNRVGSDVKLSDIDGLRKAVNDVSGQIGSNDKRLASTVIDEFDHFFSSLTPSKIANAGGLGDDIAGSYNKARDYWQRAKKTEILDEAMEKAKNQASGAENGLRTQFRQILNNKKKRSSFSAVEQESMKKIVQGTTGQNIMRNLGKFGLNGGNQGQALLPFLGAGVAGGIGGPFVAVGSVALASVFKAVANKTTIKRAEKLKQIVLNGKDPKKIALAYIENVPAKLRSPEELAGLLEKIDAKKLDSLAGTVSNSMIRDAADIASSNKIISKSEVAQSYKKTKVIPDNVITLDLDTQKIPFNSDFSAMRKSAIEFAKSNLIGKKVINGQTGHEIIVTASGIKKTLSGKTGSDLISSVSQIPDILKNGAYIGTEVNKKSHKNGVIHKYAVKMRTADGVKDVVAVVKKQEKNPYRYYFHGFLKK